MIPPLVAETFAELRKEKVSAYRNSRSLSTDLFDRIAELCNTYVLQSDSGREAIRALVSFEMSFLFFLFSGRTAEMAVRESSEKRIHQSIVALLIENETFDQRDSIVALSMVYDGASRIGLDSKDFFVKMSALGGMTMRKQLLSFAGRAPEERALSAFGIEPGTDTAGNFIYAASKN